MGKYITKEQAAKVLEMVEKLKGTNDFGKFFMACEYKQGRKWEYVGWSVPPITVDGVIKKYKDKTYAMYDINGQQRRYEMTDTIINFLEELEKQ